MIDIRHLRSFVALAETLHFGKAAQRLHITQPPLSRQIAALEAELGVSLVDRHSRRVRLTAAGQRFHQDAKATLAALDEACRSARLVDGGLRGELVLGFMMHAAQSSLPPLARRFIEHVPEVELKLREALPPVLEEHLLTGAFDAGIGFASAPRDGLHSQIIHTEPLCLVVPGHHRLAGSPRVTVSAIDGEPLIAPLASAAPALREAIDRCVAVAGVAPLIRFEVQLQHTIVSLVAEALGIALVPHSMRRLGMQDVQYIEIEGAPTVSHALFWKPDNANPALHRLLAMLGITG